MKSEVEIEDKLRELKGNRKALHDYIKAWKAPITIPDLSAILVQQLDEHRITAKIEFAEWVLKDHPF